LITGTCHCGAVKVSIPERPASVSDCNCSICRRYGALWSFFIAKTVKIEASADVLRRYLWGAKELAFVRCKNCGCVVWWEQAASNPEAKMGVNLRMFDPAVLDAAEVKKLDGASLW